MVLALLLGNLIYSQTTYYTSHAGAWSDTTAWSTIGIDSASCACSPGCNPFAGIAYIGNTMVSTNCLNGIGPNAVITVNTGDTLTITVTGIGGKLPVTNSTINIQTGGVVIINGELDIAAGDTINNSGVLTVNGNVNDSASGAYLTGTGIFNAYGSIIGTTIFTNPGLWKPVVSDSTAKITDIYYVNGNVGIGTTTPTHLLEVNGNVLFNDTLSVPVIQTHRITFFPGDTVIHIGDSSVLVDVHNNMYASPGIWGVAVGMGNQLYTHNSYAVGCQNIIHSGATNPAIAIGYKNTLTIPEDAYVIGKNNTVNSSSTSITIGANLTNSISGSIQIGGFYSTSHVPALSIYPDVTYGTAGFVGIGTSSAPNSQFNIKIPSSNGLNPFSITNSSADIFTIDKIGNTNVSGTITIYGDPSLDWTTPNLSPYPPAIPSSISGGRTAWMIPLIIPNGSAIRTATIGNTSYSDGITGRYLGFGMVDNDELDNNGHNTLTTGWYWIIQGSTSSTTNSACYPMTLIMDVNGAAILTVSQNNWQDYVFEPDYKRMSIEEKEKYYMINKHLPGIDSAGVVEKKGLNINKNMSGILQNLEEDRLDITALYKIIQQQEQEIAELKKIIENQKK